MKRETKRIFLGIPIPLETSREIIRAFEEKNSSLFNSHQRKLTEDQLHITIHFFGNVELEKLLPLQEILHRQLLTFPAFRGKIYRIARFPSRNSHLVAAYVELSLELKKLYEDIQMFIQKVSTTKDFQKQFSSTHQFQVYRPHITLCRLKRYGECVINEFDLSLMFDIGELNLYESKPTTKGSHYIILRRFTFDF